MGYSYDKLQLKKNTLLSKGKCSFLHNLALKVTDLKGDVAEVGVYKGGSAKILANALPDKMIHLFDTFVGHPDVQKVDGKCQWKGRFNDTSLQEVKKYLSDYKNVVIYKGIFPETAGPIEDKIFCFVHIDCDIYQSTMDCCKFFYPRLVQNGIIMLDDYSSSSCPGASKAIIEFFQDKFENVFKVGGERRRYIIKGQVWKP